MPAFVFLFFLLFLFFSAHGDPMAGAVSAAMGGTGRAAVEEGESVFLNPAALALMDRVYFGVGHQKGSLKGVHRDLYSVTLTDGTPGSVVFRCIGLSSSSHTIPGILVFRR